MKSNAWSAETLVRGARALDNKPSAWRASIESDKDLENAKLETCQKQGFHTDIFLIWVGSFVLGSGSLTLNPIGRTPRVYVGWHFSFAGYNFPEISFSRSSGEIGHNPQ